MAEPQIETHLTDGQIVGLRRITPDDADLIKGGIADMSERSRYLRFFSGFRNVPDSIVRQLSATDGNCHIGWGALLLGAPEPLPIGAAHMFRSSATAASGEMAIAVLDDFQHKGVSRLLLRALLGDCALGGVERLETTVLNENIAGKSLMRALDGIPRPWAGPVIYYDIDTADALRRLERALPGRPAFAEPT